MRPPAGEATPPEGAERDEVLMARYFAVLLRDPREGFAWERLRELYRARDGHVEALEGEIVREAEAHPEAWAPHMLMGHLAKARRDLDAARAAYARAAELAPERPEPAAALGDLLRLMGEPRAAIAAYEQALAHTRDRDARRELQRQLGQVALDADDYEAAERYFSEVARGADGSIFLLTEYPRALAARGRHARAVAAYERVVRQLRGDNRVRPPILLDMSREQLETGDADGAIETLQRAAGLAGSGTGTRAEILDAMTEAYRRADRLPELVTWLQRGGRRDFDRLERLGRVHDELGNDDEALEAYRAAIRIRSRDIDTRVRLIQLLSRTGRLDAVIVEYRALVRVAPGEPRFVIELAQLLARVGRRDESLSLLASTSRRHARDVGLQRALAELYAQWGEDELALGALRALTRIDPSDVAHWVALGDQLYALGRTDEAVAAWRRLLSAGDDAAAGHAEFGRVLADHDRLAEAESEYREAIRRDPKPAYLRGLASVLERPREGESDVERTARRDEAAELWARVLESAGSDEVARREARRRVVAIHAARGDLAEHQARWREAFEGDPPDVDAGRYLAEACMRRRPPDIACAERILAGIVEAAPGDVEALLALERIRRQAGDLDGAIRALALLVEANPRRAGEYLSRMAELSHDLYRDEDAVRYAEQAVERNPDDARGHRRLGDLYRARQEMDRAAAAYERALREDERLFDTYFDLAAIHTAEGRDEAADALYRRVIEICPDDDLVVRAGRASLQIHMGDGRYDVLEGTLLPLALANPRRPVFRRLIIRVYDAMALPWIDALEAEEPAEREAARRSLDALGRRGIKPLLEALASANPSQRAVPLALLGEMGNAGAIRPLLAFATGEGHVRERTQAVFAAGALAGASDLPAFRALVDRPERSLRIAARWTIARTAGQRDVSALIEALSLAEPESRGYSALALARLPSSTAARALEARLDQERERSVRAALFWALAAQRQAGVARRLREAIATEQPEARHAAALGLGHLATREAREALAGAVFATAADERRAALAVTAARPMPVPLHLPQAGSRFPVFLAEHLARVAAGGDDATAPLEADALIAAGAEALAGPLERVDAALQVLEGAGASLGGTPMPPVLSGLVEPLAALTEHRLPHVRASALGILARVPGAAGTSILGRLADPSPEVVVAALDALDPSERTAAAASVRALLEGHEAWTVRVAAARYLGRAGIAEDALRLALAEDEFAFVREAAALALRAFDTDSAREARSEAHASDVEARVRDAAGAPID